MSDSVAPPRPNEGGGYDFARLVPQRSFGLKLILVCALALAMAIPAGFVWMIFASRAGAAQAAIYDVTSLQAGSQNLLGPVIIVPFERDVIVSVNTVNNTVNQLQTQAGRMVLYPETGEADTTLVTEIRKRGLQEIPVFTANAVFKASFNPSRIAAEAPTGARLHWNEARVVMNVRDLRGAKDARLTIGGQTLEVAPIEINIAEVNGQAAQQLRLLGASLGWTGEPVAAPLSAEATLNVSGAQSISVSAFARDTTIRLSGNWGSPSFDSGVLPDTRTVEKDRFEAEWRIPFLARGVPGAGADLWFDRVISPGATLLDEGNPYQSVERALKYAPLFIGLVFLTYFLFEVTSGRRAHPAQYVLVGLAQTIFYMLLLSVSEVMGFSLGFLLAAIATVLALSLYAGAVFGSRAAVAKALAVFSALYALIYVLLRQEEYGLLVGSIASFLAIAGTMWMTRKLDWYGVGRTQAAPQG
jgi:inner membrane protein